MANIEFRNVKGFSELMASLRDLPNKVQRKTMRKGVGSGARVIRNEARALFRQRWNIRTGRLVRAIVLKYIPEKSVNGRVTYYVCVKKVDRRYANSRVNKRSGRAGKNYQVEGSAYYWRFLEFGTAYIRSRPFMRPAFENKKMEAIEEMRRSMKDTLEKLDLKRVIGAGA